MKINVIVNLTFEALHCWLDCKLKEEFYLKYPHRHVFYITCKKEVTHANRDIEFIGLKKRIKNYLIDLFEDDNGNYDLGEHSCEKLAVRILNDFALNYCSVLEDNENGAEVIK